MEPKFIIAIGILSVGLLAGIFVLAGQNGGIAAMGADLSRAFGSGSQWIQIQPRIAAADDAADASSDEAGGITADAANVSKPVSAITAKAKKTAVVWCDPASAAGTGAAGTVIIDEVAWMGTDVSYSDEWIELENRSSASADLSGWQLQNKNRKLKISFGSGDIIPSQGVYLLERTGDDTVNGIAANKIYTGGLANSNEALYLFDGDCNLRDSVIASPDWPAGDNAAKKTMVRLANLNWANSTVSGGTPGSK